jgi:hypothetical protein
VVVHTRRKHTGWGVDTVPAAGKEPVHRGLLRYTACAVEYAFASPEVNPALYHNARLTVPFFLVHTRKKERPSDRWALLRATAPVTLVPAPLILPFLLWGAASFVDDTYLYLSGQSTSSYPITGLGFGGLLVSQGLVKDNNDYFPFVLFQLALCVPLLVILLRQQRHHSTLQRSWLGYGLALLRFTFFSRFFSGLYLGIVVPTIVRGYLCDGGQPDIERPEGG